MMQERRDALDLTIEDWILALLAYSNGVIRGKTRLHKALFILDRLEEIYDSDFVPTEFKPHDYGPWSYEIEEALRKLEREGLVKIEYKATNSEEPVALIKATPNALEKGKLILKKLRKTNAWRDIDARMYFATRAPLLELLWYVYDLWPEYTENSVIRRKLRYWRKKKLLYPEKSFTY